MKLLKRPTKPVSGFAVVFHVVFTAFLPFLLYVLVRLDFVWLAYAILFVSKWRVFAVKPRHWLANLRINAVDILVGIAAIIFMSNSGDTAVVQQILVTIGYTFWLLFLKPRSSKLWVGVQALVGQTVSLLAAYSVLNESSELTIVMSVWTIAYFSARHFLAVYDEPMARASAYVWAFFAGALAWVTSKWLLYFSLVSQPALILIVVGYGMASLYYVTHAGIPSKSLRRQFSAATIALIMLILVFSDWSGEII